MLWFFKEFNDVFNCTDCLIKSCVCKRKMHSPLLFLWNQRSFYQICIYLTFDPRRHKNLENKCFKVDAHSNLWTSSNIFLIPQIFIPSKIFSMSSYIFEKKIDFCLIEKLMWGYWFLDFRTDIIFNNSWLWLWEPISWWGLILVAFCSINS